MDGVRTRLPPQAGRVSQPNGEPLGASAFPKPATGDCEATLDEAQIVASC